MKHLIAAAFVASIGLAGVSASQAMPTAPLDQAQAGMAIQIAHGCGIGRHRGPYGGCRARYSCPAGWHSGVRGLRCYRDR